MGRIIVSPKQVAISLIPGGIPATAIPRRVEANFLYALQQVWKIQAVGKRVRPYLRRLLQTQLRGEGSQFLNDCDSFRFPGVLTRCEDSTGVGNPKFLRAFYINIRQPWRETESIRYPDQISAIIGGIDAEGNRKLGILSYLVVDRGRRILSAQD